MHRVGEVTVAEGFGVDNAHVVEVGGQVVKVADAVHESAGGLAGTVDGLSQSNPGFDCVGVLISCAEAWRSELTGLGALVAEAGDTLHATAACYHDTEQLTCGGFTLR